MAKIDVEQIAKKLTACFPGGPNRKMWKPFSGKFYCFEFLLHDLTNEEKEKLYNEQILPAWRHRVSVRNVSWAEFFFILFVCFYVLSISL